MADVFISYARADKARVAPLVKAIEAKGWSVWWDPAITPGQEFDDEIDLELQNAKAVLVVWTPTSVASRWVRGEARDGAERGILVPVRFDQARLPIDVRAIHTTDLDDWREDPASAPAQAFLQALATTIARAGAAQADAQAGASVAPAKAAPRYAVCVLPFVNMSGDPEQEYFSDGITEDIITDLSKVSSLGVVSRNDSFLYKGKQVEMQKVAAELKVTHVMEGSVRRAGGRLRITAQLIDGATSQHVWAERYDRDASDIFAIQDEISHAIVSALKLRLMPAERKAIERRGTESVEAHDLYLMARQTYITSQADERASEAIVRTCKRATDLDPNYAQAWALMAMGYRSLRELGVELDDGMVAANRALKLDPRLAEAHAVKAYILQMKGAMDEAAAEAESALKMDPESYEANRTAGRIAYQLHRFDDAARYYGKAVDLMDSDVNSAIQLVSSRRAVGDAVGVRSAGEVALKRANAVLAHDRNNAGIIAYSAYALAALGDGDGAKARMTRAMLIEPSNWWMRYNFACALNSFLHDAKAALEMLAPAFAPITTSLLQYLKDDPDFLSLHEDPRFKIMVAAAEKRLAGEQGSATLSEPENAPAKTEVAGDG